METVRDFILGGSKITADGDCCHETKRCLVLGRKVMTNLDSMLKSRYVTLPTKVRLVSLVQLLSHVRLFVTPWIAAHQASLSITKSRSSLKPTSIKSVMPSSHLILCCPFSPLQPKGPSKVFSNPTVQNHQFFGVQLSLQSNSHIHTWLLEKP